MARMYFPAARTLSGAAVKFLISISVNAVGLGGSQAEPRYHCPAGQIYRVSKKICVPKESQLRSSTSSKTIEKAAAPSRMGNHAADPPRSATSPLASSPDLLSAAIEEPKVEEAETPLIAQPESVTPSTSPDLKSDPDTVLQVRLARESETSKLENDVVLYREALKEQTRERAPLKRAATQNNLANALATLGERESSGTAKLGEATALYREALQEWTRESAPLEWAAIQNNLAQALAALAERESGMALLAEALAVKREVRDWATRTGNQGVSLMLHADQSGNSTMARTALRQIEIAFMTIRDGAYEPLLAAYYEEKLPTARALVERLSQR